MTAELCAVSAEELFWLRVSVPIASFAVPFTREFIESYPFPTPATIYGMLLSYVGETDRLKYVGTEFGVVVTNLADPSIVLRKIRRVKSSNLNDKNNSKPEFQTLLTGLEFFIGIRNGATDDGPDLASDLLSAWRHPERIARFGGLSCGESHNLIDELSLVGADILQERGEGNSVFALEPRSEGEWSVPIWVDHVGSAGTVWARTSFASWDDRSTLRLFRIVNHVA